MFDLLETIIRVLCWPYQIWKYTIENSRIGASPDEHATLHFWKRFAMYGALMVLGLAGVVVILVRLM